MRQSFTPAVGAGAAVDPPAAGVVVELIGGVVAGEVVAGGVVAGAELVLPLDEAHPPAASSRPATPTAMIVLRMMPPRCRRCLRLFRRGAGENGKVILPSAVNRYGTKTARTQLSSFSLKMR
ncbi:hypothetical protein Ade02nite_72650 [Paractinoplanes deccanensis]|uniref:Uncharacterized protein n=1 Tax=Paractinoplanes deccanensis TaxID=113561 RepID=A0ABQ3YF45_9ACTN|nr:hypothetical protein Ade02nite_72650 [Actinoplanes deccanensis]